MGCGVQIEVSYGPGVVGLELVFYNDDIRNAGNEMDLGIVRNHFYEPYVYLYLGGGVTSEVVSELTDSAITVAHSLANKPTLIDRAEGISPYIPKGITVSVCIFAIIGNEKFENPLSYAGLFVGASGCINHIKGFIATAETCITVGAGISTSKFSCGGALTDYDLLGNGEIDFYFYKELAEYIAPKAEALSASY